MTAQPLRAALAKSTATTAAVLLVACGGGGGDAAPAAPAQPNSAPQITTSAVTTAAVGRPYAYELKATDPEGDSLTYTLSRAPAGMTIQPSTGSIAWTPSAAQAGSQDVSVRVADPAGLAATQAFSIVVQVVNTAPRITSTPATAAAVGARYSYPVQGSDPEGDALAYSLTEAPTGMSIDAASGLVGWTPTAAQLGSHRVTVRVQDPGGLTASQAYTVTVSAGNGPPQITSTPVTTATAGAAYRYTVAATDPNADTLAFALTQAPAGMVIQAATGVIDWTPTAGQIGSHPVTVRAADPAGLAATQTFSVAVAAPNAAPQITSTPVTTATVGAPYAYDVNATDSNGDTLTYSLTQAPGGMTINAGSGLIGWTPSSGQTGSHAVTVRVADPGGLAATQTFTIVVPVPNAAPQITSAPVTTAPVGAAYQYDVDATDPNGDTLTYSLTQAPSGMTIQAGSGLINWTPAAAQTGSHAVTARVADPGGLAATQSFTVVVPNAPPVITSTAVTAAGVGATYSYDVNATDLNGDTLTYSLTQAPSGMTIQAASGLITWVPLSGQAGTHAVSVRAADPGGLAATQSFNVVAGGGTRIDMATPATYSAVSGGTAAITLNWGRIPMAANYQQFMHLVNTAGQSWSVDDHPTTSSTWTTGAFTETRTVTVPASLPSGTYDIRVGLAGGDPWLNLVLATGTGVTDPGTDRRYRVASITVVGNQAPSITSTAVTTAAVGAAYSYDVNATDPNAGDVLTYSLTQAPSGMTINATNGLIAWTPSAAQGGNQAVTVRVADPQGLAATQSFTINVAPAAGSPVITSTPVTTATAGVAYSYDVNATDPTGETITYSLTQAPSGMSINAASGLIAWTPSAAQVGSHSVTVRAADPGGLASTQSYAINVVAAPTTGPMTMSCADGAGTQCSGDAILRTDNGVALTRSGVHVHGRSTSDLLPVNPNVSSAYGLALASGGTAELRIRKDGNARPTTLAFLLANMSILWDGVNNRPLLIETFTPTAGRVWLDANGALTFGSLPPSSDLTYYNYATLGTAATKANYANNRYFPRTDPPRCVPGGFCATGETNGPSVFDGSWRFGGGDPDRLLATRNHEDGDVHAGNGLPDANGNPTWLPGGSGFGVPMPGSKGYRAIDHWSYQYANLAAWFTQDTINIAEWGGAPEHNKNRRGFMAYGDTTTPANVPTTGSASYTGVVRGRYAPNAVDEPAPFVGTVTVTVNFASRSVTVTIQNTVREDNGASVPVALTATPTLRTAGDANHLMGPAANAAMSGGLGARLFGPVASGGSGTGPAEIGGAFSLSNTGTGAAVVAGFIGRKQ
jgi:hypothetical protein